MGLAGIYTLLDRTIIIAEGGVTFPQFLNPQMDFETASQLMEDGAELIRASKRRTNSEFAITSNKNRYARLPQYSEYWYNVEDGYIPQTLSEEDKSAKDWVLVVPPLSLAFAYQGSNNYSEWKPLPAPLQQPKISYPDDDLVPF